MTISYVNNAADGSTGACPDSAELITAEELSDAGWCTDYQAGVDSAGKCLKTLGVSGSTTGSVYVPNPDNKCIAGSMGLGGFASCQDDTYPNGYTQCEFTLNPKATTMETFDISAVNGVNYALSVYLADDTNWGYEDGSSIENNTVGPNNELDNNIGVKGVFPPNCTDCIQLIGTITCSGLTPDPPTCNSTRICNVNRSNSPGGTVEFKIGELY